MAFVEQAREFDDGMAKAIGECMKDKDCVSGLAPRGLGIATITVSFKTNMDFCDITDVESYENAYMPAAMSMCKAKGRKGNRMLNSLTFKLDLNGDGNGSGNGDGDRDDVGNRKARTERASMMLFCNGSLNITGCKTVEEAYGCGLIMCAFLDRKHGDPKGTTKIRKMKVGMVNTNFVTGSGAGFDLHAVHDLLVNKMKCNAVFEKDVHPGVLWFYRTTYEEKPEVTIAIFSTGSVVITGIVAPSQVTEAYEAVTGFLGSEFEGIQGMSNGNGNDMGMGKGQKKKRGRKPKAVSEAMDAKFAKLVG